MAGDFDLQLDFTLDRLTDNLTVYKTALRREANHATELRQQLATKDATIATMEARVRDVEGMMNQYVQELAEAQMIIATLTADQDVATGDGPPALHSIPDNLVSMNGNARVLVPPQA